MQTMKTTLKIMIIAKFEVLLRELQNLITILNKRKQQLESWNIPL